MRRIQCLAAFLLFLFISVGCATRIPIQRLVGATHDMGAYRSLALMATEPYRYSPIERSIGAIADLSEQSPVIAYTGYQLFSERELASNITNRLEEALGRSGYFTLVLPKQAQAYPSQHDAALWTHVSRMDIEEYLFAHKLADDRLAHLLRQRIALAITYEVIDSNTGAVIYRDTVHARDERTYAIDPDESPVLFAPPLLPLFKELADSVVESIARSLAPRRETFRVSLMSNKPALEAVSPAYKAAAAGDTVSAYHLFLTHANEGHIPSIYNAALLAESLGRREEAIIMMRRLGEEHGIERAIRQLRRMEQYRKEELRAQSQF